MSGSGTVASSDIDAKNERGARKKTEITTSVSLFCVARGALHRPPSVSSLTTGSANNTSAHKLASCEEGGHCVKGWR